jgi:hypothetical protein
MNPRGLIAACILAAVGTASAMALSSMVSESLAQGVTEQSGASQGWNRLEGTPMQRYKAASKGAAATLKAQLEECRQLEKTGRSACARQAREQQRVNVVQANAKITQEIASSHGPGPMSRN